MPEWAMWLIVAGIGLLTGIIVHAVMRQSQGGAMMGVLLAGIMGALIASWLLTRLVEMPGVTQTEERYGWAFIGGLVLSALYELASIGSQRSRIVIPAPGR